MQQTKPEQHYGPTSGAITGVTGLVGCLFVAVWLPIAKHDLVAIRWALGAGALAVLLWCFMLRPRIIVQPETLVLRNPLSSWLVPLVAVERVQVRVVTRVGTSGRTYDAVAVGRPIRSLIGAQRATSPGIFGGSRSLTPPPLKARPLHESAPTPDGVAALMTEQVLAAAERARHAGLAEKSVRRAWAIPELALVGALALALALTWLV